jgi:hypothetical protein
MDKELCVIYSDCRRCCITTRHEVMFETMRELKEEWINMKDTWQVVRCLGCHTISFRHQNDDYDDLEEDALGQVEHAVTVDIYPGLVSNHKGLTGTFYLPVLISKIYGQTLKALGEKAFVLASIGLRATIEAVCNHLELSGTNLEKRIDLLCKAGHVSNGDKRRLHAIRFLGNDAAHEIKEPVAADLRVALEIVEHLLNTVFILERRARSLETVVENFGDFLKVLRVCAHKYESDNAINLLGLLGRQKRLVGQGLDAFESELKQKISSGEVDFLTLGQTQQVGGKDVQLYEVKRSAFVDDDFDFDF